MLMLFVWLWLFEGVYKLKPGNFNIIKYFQFSSYKTNVNIIAIAQTETKIKGYDMRILFNINLKAL